MKNEQKGFTLVELLAVIVILAIILLIAIPTVLSIIEEAKEDAFLSNVKMIEEQVGLIMLQDGYVSTEMAYTVEGNVITGNVDELEMNLVGFSGSWTYERDSKIITLSTISDGTYIATVDSNTSFDDYQAVKLGDISIPDITLVGDEEITLEEGSVLSWIDPEISVVDALDPNVIDSLVVDGEVLDTVGIYNLTYTVTNIYGVERSVSRVVNVENDITLPELSSNVESITVNLGDNFIAPLVSATDNKDILINDNIEISGLGDVDVNTEGTYLIIYNVSDSDGNEAIPVSVVVNVVYNLDWLYKQEITIDSSKVDSNLTNFPLTIKLDDSNFDFGSSLPNGADIRFVDETYNSLSFEREVHIDGNAVYHVKVPTVSSSSDTKIYMYYGNPLASDAEDPTNVWDSNYLMVQHMGADLEDSTSNNNDLTNYGSSVVESNVGLARSFDGVDDYLSFNDLNIKNTDFTISTFNYDEVDAAYRFSLTMSSSVNDGNYILLSNSAFLLRNDENPSRVTISPAYGSHPTGYHYTSGNWDESTKTAKFILDNNTPNIAQDLSFTTIDNQDSFRIASYVDNASGDIHYFNKIVDEVRVSNIIRTDDWINTEYESLSGNLVTISSNISNNSVTSIDEYIVNELPYVQTFTVDSSKIDEGLTDFPVTIVLDNGNFNFTTAHADGSDIVFIDTEGNLLAFEREIHDTVNKKAVYHIKLNTISNASNTRFKMYYGNLLVNDVSNSDSVWSEYLLVTHLNTELEDLSLNNSSLTNNGTSVVSANLNEGRLFDGSSNIHLGDIFDKDLNDSSNWTITTISKLDTLPEVATTQFLFSLNYLQQYSYYRSTSWSAGFYSSDDYKEAAYTGPYDINYNYFVNTYDGTNLKVVINDEVNQTNIVSNATSMPLEAAATNPNQNYLGSAYSGYNNFTGIIDEFRITELSRSEAWLKAEYHSMFNTLIIY